MRVVMINQDSTTIVIQYTKRKKKRIGEDIRGIMCVCASHLLKAKRIAWFWLGLFFVESSFLLFNSKLMEYSTCDLHPLFNPQDIMRISMSPSHSCTLHGFVFAFWESHSSPPQTNKANPLNMSSSLLSLCKLMHIIIQREKRSWRMGAVLFIIKEAKALTFLSLFYFIFYSFELPEFGCDGYVLLCFPPGSVGPSLFLVLETYLTSLRHTWKGVGFVSLPKIWPLG